MRYKHFILWMALVLVLSACGSTAGGTVGGGSTPPPAAAAVAAGPLRVSDPWVRAVPAMGEMGGANGALYLTIQNTGSSPDRLINVQSDVAKTVELHTVIKNGDVMEMRPVEAIDVPAGGEAALKPGGFHVMMIGLTRDLKAGDRVAITLQFEKAGPVALQAEVRQ